MYNILLEVADKLCPVKEFCITKRKPVYLTNEVIELIKERNTVLRLARNHNNKDYWLRGQSLIKEVVKAVSVSKKEYVIKQLKENQKDGGKFWKSVKLILPDNKSSNILLSGTLRERRWSRGRRQLIW